MPPWSSTARQSSHPEVVKAHLRTFRIEAHIGIKDFCAANGLKFERGKLYYELVKPVLVQGTKKIILADRATMTKFSTGRWVREQLGLPTTDRDAKLNAFHWGAYRVFIQSTSNNRKLLPGQMILYEVDAPKVPTVNILSVWDRLAGDDDLI